MNILMHPRNSPVFISYNSRTIIGDCQANFYPDYHNAVCDGAAETIESVVVYAKSVECKSPSGARRRSA